MDEFEHTSQRAGGRHEITFYMIIMFGVTYEKFFHVLHNISKYRNIHVVLVLLNEQFICILEFPN